MSTSKIEELKQIVEKDIKSTEEYVEAHLKFIQELINRLPKFLNCSVDELCFMDSLKELSPAKDFDENITNKNLIIIDKKCFFNFKIVVCIVASIPKNRYDKIIREQGLLASETIVLPIAIKKQENLFEVKVSQAEYSRRNEINIEVELNNDNSWFELLNSCFLVMKEIAQASIEERAKI